MYVQLSLLALKMFSGECLWYLGALIRPTILGLGVFILSFPSQVMFNLSVVLVLHISGT